MTSLPLISLSSAPAVYTSLAPVPPSITTHLSCHSSYHSLTLTPPLPHPAFPLLHLLLVSLIYRRQRVVHTHSTSDTLQSPTLLPPDPHILPWSFIFVILRWREEEQGLKDETIGGVLFLLSRPDYLSVHLSVPLAALIGVGCVCVNSVCRLAVHLYLWCQTFQAWRLLHERVCRVFMGNKRRPDAVIRLQDTHTVTRSLLQTHHIHNPQSTNPLPRTPLLARPN